jgi:hypothetical protein
MTRLFIASKLDRAHYRPPQDCPHSKHLELAETFSPGAASQPPDTGSSTRERSFIISEHRFTLRSQNTSREKGGFGKLLCTERDFALKIKVTFLFSTASSVPICRRALWSLS